MPDIYLMNGKMLSQEKIKEIHIQFHKVLKDNDLTVEEAMVILEEFTTKLPSNSKLSDHFS